MPFHLSRSFPHHPLASLALYGSPAICFLGFPLLSENRSDIVRLSDYVMSIDDVRR